MLIPGAPVAALVWYHVAELGTPPPFEVVMTDEEIDEYLYLCTHHASWRTAASWRMYTKVDEEE